ncbi:hypothetical protein CRI94_12050 [Longibacter salinarum]|uniref:Regulator of microtubule dynamics protein 1 n=1 Tax=Longibacter salinarum TaxID=1850348 RepID=A0A2A8CWJ6_9BACT|nr:hypothetical protein [Longibacter salinarum]PEN12967.1 hypothetical protein CRI94_12050 [Longibacter salinarum]
MMSNRLPTRFGLSLTLATLVLLFVSLVPMSAAAQTPDPDEIDASPELKPNLVEADSLRRAGAFREAFGLLTSLKQEHPSNAEVLYRLALTRVDMGEIADSGQRRQSMYKSALEDAKAAVEADTALAFAHLSRAIAEGRVALTAGTKEKIQRSRAVKRHADQAIELDPDMASAYHVRARWNREVADLGFFSRAIVKTVYGGLPEASFEQSVRDFKTAIQKEDKIVHHIELARTYMKMDREDAAKEELQTVLAMENEDPDDPQHKKEAEELLNDLS